MTPPWPEDEAEEIEIVDIDDDTCGDEPSVHDRETMVPCPRCSLCPLCHGAHVITKTRGAPR